MTSLLSPMDLNNLLHHLLTGFRQVLLVVWQFGCRTFTRVNFTVLNRCIKTSDKVPCGEKESTVKTKQKPIPFTTSHLWFTLPSVSMRYFWPTSFMYSSMALVANVFSLKISASLSPRRSTSAPPKSTRNSWSRHNQLKTHVWFFFCCCIFYFLDYITFEFFPSVGFPHYAFSFRLFCLPWLCRYSVVHGLELLPALPFPSHSEVAPGLCTFPHSRPWHTQQTLCTSPWAALANSGNGPWCGEKPVAPGVLCSLLCPKPWMGWWDTTSPERSSLWSHLKVWPRCPVGAD